MPLSHRRAEESPLNVRQEKTEDLPVPKIKISIFFKLLYEFLLNDENNQRVEGTSELQNISYFETGSPYVALAVLEFAL